MAHQEFAQAIRRLASIAVISLAKSQNCLGVAVMSC